MALTINGTYTYTKPLNTVYVDSEGNLRDPEVPRARGSILLPEVTAAYPDLKDMAGRYNIASNDAITVANGRPVNMHLRKAVDEGTKKQAAWAQEHPYFNIAGIAAGSIPLAVAAAPAVVGGGELAATALANPYVDAALTSMGGAHAAQSLANGEANWMTALELAPLGRLAKPLYEGVVQPGMRLFNSPLTGNWTKIGNREYRLSPYSLGANGSPLESRSITTELNISPEELYKALQEQEGYYFMGHGTGRTNVDPEVIFNNGLRIKNGDIANTTSPLSESNLVTWPHANSKEVIILPARAENTMFDSAYGRIPSDWYDANTFQWIDDPGFEGSGLFAVQKPNASFVETVVNGVPGVYTKPGAILGSYNTDTHVLRLNPNSQYKFPFSANTASKITAENAASITPEQWTAAQDAAIARGDMAEAQRLRDLHFKAKAPEADVPDQFHGTHYEDLGNQILLNKGVEQGTNGVGFYTSSNKPYARKYGPNIFKFKVNAKTEDLAQGRFAYLSENKMNELKAQGYKGTIDDTSGPMLGAGRDAVEYTFFDPNIYKSANAVTYDDNGVRIPLGERDNFKLNDIRYGLLPFLGLGAAGTLYKNLK